MQTVTLHIKIEPELAKSLKSLSQKRKISVGELVRQAVYSHYQLDLDISLNNRQCQTLQAYQGGYISLSKLASDMGMSIWEMQEWLAEHNIAQNTMFQENDVSNA